MPKKWCFRGPFDNQHGKRSYAPLKSASEHLCHIHWSLPRQLSRKRSLLLTSQMLGPLVNTLDANYKYPVLNRDNLTKPMQTHLSQKEITFSKLLARFMKSRLNFKYFQRKDNPHRFCISDITDLENVVW